MTEKQIISKEIIPSESQASIDAEKANACALGQLLSTVKIPKKVIRPLSLRATTDDIETNVSREKKEVISVAKA
jgi:hypothetical protein